MWSLDYECCFLQWMTPSRSHQEIQEKQTSSRSSFLLQFSWWISREGKQWQVFLLPAYSSTASKWIPDTALNSLYTLTWGQVDSWRTGAGPWFHLTPMCHTRFKPPPPPMWPMLKCTGSFITFQTKVCSRTATPSRIQAPNEFVHPVVPGLHFHPAYPHYGCVHKPLPMEVSINCKWLPLPAIFRICVLLFQCMLFQWYSAKSSMPFFLYCQTNKRC